MDPGKPSFQLSMDFVPPRRRTVAEVIYLGRSVEAVATRGRIGRPLHPHVGGRSLPLVGLRPQNPRASCKTSTSHGKVSTRVGVPPSLVTTFGITAREVIIYQRNHMYTCMDATQDDTCYSSTINSLTPIQGSNTINPHPVKLLDDPALQPCPAFGFRTVNRSGYRV